MLNKFNIIFIISFMSLLTYNLAYFYQTKDIQIFHPRNFYKYEGRYFVGHLVHYIYLGTDECIKACRNNKECFAVTIISVNCHLQSKDTALSSKNAAAGMTIYTRRIPDIASRSYCKKYKHVCGECKCIDQMETKIPYQCDCSVAGTRGNCDEHRLAGFKTSGVYLINLRDSTSHQIFCKMDLDGKAYMLIMRRSDGVPYGFKNRDAYVSSFGDFQSNYWYGLENLHVITNIFNMKLIIEYVDRSYKKHEVSSDNFKIGNSASNYDVTTGTTNYLGTSFKECKSVEHYWTTKEECLLNACIDVPLRATRTHQYGWWWSCRNNYGIPTHKSNVYWDGNLVYNLKMYVTKH